MAMTALHRANLEIIVFCAKWYGCAAMFASPIHAVGDFASYRNTSCTRCLFILMW
jgi:hypothetical protein